MHLKRMQNPYFCPTDHTPAINPEKTTYAKMAGELRYTALYSTLAPRYINSETIIMLSPNI
ncbi:hypothetical protein HZS_4992 [Henneguya salminicola]|nr:hypothetical protein HZS_4992 [Henneguya salminicola]